MAPRPLLADVAARKGSETGRRGARMRGRPIWPQGGRAARHGGAQMRGREAPGRAGPGGRPSAQGGRRGAKNPAVPPAGSVRRQYD